MSSVLHHKGCLLFNVGKRRGRHKAFLIAKILLFQRLYKPFAKNRKKTATLRVAAVIYNG